MNDRNISPSMIGRIYSAIEAIKRYDISERDILIMIQTRTSPKVSQKVIKNVLYALNKLETNFLSKLEAIGH